jgi:hypothetical protein
LINLFWRDLEVIAPLRVFFASFQKLFVADRVSNLFVDLVCYFLVGFDYDDGLFGLVLLRHRSGHLGHHVLLYGFVGSKDFFVYHQAALEFAVAVVQFTSA